MKIAYRSLNAFAGVITSASIACASALDVYDKRNLDGQEIESRRMLNILSGDSLEKKTYSTSSQPRINNSFMPNLTRHGVTVCKSILSPKALQSWNNKIQKQLEIPGTCVVPIKGSKGRRHCFPPVKTPRSKNVAPPQWVTDLSRLGGDRAKDETLKNKNIKEVSSRLGYIAKEYFSHHGISEDQYGITQLQMLYAEKDSEHQIWHRDNSGGPSLTALVALKDISSNGPTEILLGSHRSLFSEEEKLSAEEMYDTSADIQTGVLLATLQAGDAIVYDARILHRGRGYSFSTEDRPVLIIRWDAHNTPPPGTGFIGTQLAIVSGIGLVSIENIKTKLGINS